MKPGFLQCTVAALLAVMALHGRLAVSDSGQAIPALPGPERFARAVTPRTMGSSRGAFTLLNRFQVEWDSLHAAERLRPTHGESYYFFRRDPGTSVHMMPGGTITLRCGRDSCRHALGPGLVATGLYETATGWGPYPGQVDFLRDAPQGYSGTLGGEAATRELYCGLRAAIDNSAGLDPDAEILTCEVFTWDGRTGVPVRHEITLRRRDFAEDLLFTACWIKIKVPPAATVWHYAIYTTNACDVYIDWVEAGDTAEMVVGRGPLALKDTELHTPAIFTL
ncbi:MAG: hypothetical protein C4524_01240 [Candidatus Zixiibacteriota bacterium]|nr:MAG: hypothetical protein C4524_01240 [candidate division Zixibacteria bacterium]